MNVIILLMFLHSPWVTVQLEQCLIRKLLFFLIHPSPHAKLSHYMGFGTGFLPYQRHFHILMTIVITQMVMVSVRIQIIKLQDVTTHSLLHQVTSIKL